jgi:hypothetical protein
LFKAGVDRGLNRAASFEQAESQMEVDVRPFAEYLGVA